MMALQTDQRAHAWLASIAVACFAPAGANAAEPAVLILAVGANQGLASERPLRFADRDAERYVATVAAVSAAPVVHREVLVDPTKAELRAALDRLGQAAQTTQGGARVHFYFSGHGDRASLHLAGERVSLTAVQRRIDGLPGQLRLAVIDACRSEDITLKGFERGPGFTVSVLKPTVRGTVVLNAASDGESAQESEDLQGAVFTQALLTGLRGAADVDGDRQVTLAELYRHAYRQTVLRSSMTAGNVMHPSVKLDLEGAGEVVLARIGDQRARITVPAETGARYVIFERTTASVIAEIWSDPRRDVPLPVAPGAYLITRRGPEGASAREIDLGPEEARLRPATFRSVDAALLARKGGALRLFTHELRGGFSGTYRLGLGYSGFVAWSFGSPRWRAGVVGRVGSATYSGDALDFVTLEAEGELRGLRRFGNLDAIIGLFGRNIRTEGTARDAAERQALGLPSETNETGLGFGPKVALRYRIPFGDRLDVGLEVAGTAVILREDTEWTARPEVFIDLSFGVEP